MADVDETQRRLAAEVMGTAMAAAARAELRSPFLALATEDGRTLRYAIKTPDVEPHVVMKVLLSLHRATHAAICFEGWGVEERRPADVDAADWGRDAISGRLPLGRVRPMLNPDRFDMLVLISQARDTPAAGHIHRQWRIEPGHPRTFHEWDLTGAFEAPSNFWPMFARYDEIRAYIRLYAVLARMVDEVRRGP